ncbi:uncharacterized protein LOC110118912 [Ceratitis capitata]|uniref:uncharacterized protein LOC110118912 n=1 Tax=Ceratitis capitata TaxID=7213 RepID=UPI000A110FEA|nr:uncharacterized protein LOC110118912 [Ceratitis capitata]
MKKLAENWCREISRLRKLVSTTVHKCRFALAALNKVGSNILNKLIERSEKCNSPSSEYIEKEKHNISVFISPLIISDVFLQGSFPDMKPKYTRRATAIRKITSNKTKSTETVNSLHIRRRKNVLSCFNKEERPVKMTPPPAREHLNIKKIEAHWVRRMLTLLDKQRQLETCKDFLEWKKKAKTASKIMAIIFWDSEGILLIDYFPKGTAMNDQRSTKVTCLDLTHPYRKKSNDVMSHYLGGQSAAPLLTEVLH